MLQSSVVSAEPNCGPAKKKELMVLQQATPNVIQDLHA